jgi:hypothetical protein
MNTETLFDFLLGESAPPTINEVKAYFLQKGIPELEAEHFFLLHEYRGWRTRKGSPIRNWKTAAYRWILGAWLWNPLLFEKGAR